MLIMKHINTRRIKPVIFVVLTLFIFAGSKIFPQVSIMDKAFGGKKGIFVYFDKDIPLKGNSGEQFYYLIERRVENTKEWKILGTIYGPANFTEFKNSVNLYHTQLPYLIMGNNNVLDKIWEISNKYRRIDSLYSYAQVPIYGLALGTIFLDTSAVENTNYEYKYSKVSITKKILNTVQTFAVKYPGKVSFKKIVQKTSRSDGNKIFIQWITSNEKIPVFRVMREDNLSPPFHLINPAKGVNAGKDGLNIYVQDTLINPKSIYRYYIIPEDIFGNEGENSDTVIIGNYNFKEVSSLPDSIKVEGAPHEGGIKLTWQPKNDPSIRFIDIYKSVKYDTGYVRLVSLAPNQTSYLDQHVKPNITYYYYFIAEGQLGETSTKSPRFFGVYADPDAPFPPFDVTGEGIKSGVKLQWTRNESYTRGYYVYRSSNVDGTMEQVSQLIPAKDSIVTFVDKDSTLSGQVTYAYAVKAENTSYVKSVFSDTVYVRPSISTKPLTPTDVKAMVSGKSVSVYWDDMSALQNGIDGYDLLRKESNKTGKMTGNYKVVNDSTIPPYQNHFTDTGVIRGNTYMYAVRSRDIFDGVSDLSNPVVAQIKGISVIPPAGVSAKKANGGIEITWYEGELQNLYGYRIYRYERGKKPIYLGIVRNGSEPVFEDKKVKSGNLYFYYVTSYLISGEESEPSLEVGIRY
jgi:fibronectin type 3 domain-containing protein